MIWTYPENSPYTDAPVLDTPEDEEPIGLAGLAVREGRPVATGDYMVDQRFKHYKEGDEGVQEVNLHSVITAPVVGEDGLVGVFQAGHRDRDAFGEDALRLLDALAGQASVALANARLVDRLATSQGALERTADAERALREIARRMMTIQDPAELLQDVVDEAARLLGSSGAVIDLLDPATGEVHWAHDAGMDEATRSEWKAPGRRRIGVHLAIRERRVVLTAEYAADDRFPDGAPHREFFDRVGIRSIAFAPLIGEAVVLGTLAVFSGEVGRFSEQDGALLAALADLATIAIHNAELIRELGRSREETSRRAETERTLREIAARVTAIRDADAILGLIVDETRRVLASDGAHLTRISDDRTLPHAGRPRGRHGRRDPRAGCAPSSSRSTAASTGSRPARAGSSGPPPTRRTRGSRAIRATSRPPSGWASGRWRPPRCAPPAARSWARLRSATGQSGTIAPDRLATLQALADHAAIALSNSDLLERLEASEANFRGLVQTTPGRDLAQRRGRPVHVPRRQRARQLFGWTAAEMTGMHFSAIVAEDSMGTALQSWAELHDPETSSLRLRFVVRRKDGTHLPDRGCPRSAIFEDGEFRAPRAPSATSASASASSAISTSPRSATAPRPVVARPHLRDGRPTACTRSTPTAPRSVIGWPPGELIGRPFTEFIDIEAFPQAARAARRDRGQPGPPVDGPAAHPPQGRRRTIPFEVSVVGQVDEEGQLVAIRGVARDISERERLELELRASEERYRFLVENAPDIVFSADAETRFLFISDTIERLTGFRPEERGRPDVRHDRRALDDARRGRALGARRGRPDRAAGPAPRAAAQGRRHRPGRDPLGRPARRPTASSPASTGPRATSASGSASSASCASPRTATATWSSRRPTSSG